MDKTLVRVEERCVIVVPVVFRKRWYPLIGREGDIFFRIPIFRMVS